MKKVNGFSFHVEQLMSDHIFHQVLVRNVWCAGRNYADHAKEMKAEVPNTPVIFLKSGTSISTGSVIHLPSWSKEIHHEIEIAFWLNENLEYSHFTLALDLTARDAQADAKSKGLPWTLAKSFKDSCPMGQWVDLNSVPNLESLELELKINGVTKQFGDVSQMIFSPQILLSYIKEHFPVAAKDVILTGTPSGVGPLKNGDKLEAILRDKTSPNNQPLLVCQWDVN